MVDNLNKWNIKILFTCTKYEICSEISNTTYISDETENSIINSKKGCSVYQDRW